MSVRQRTLPCPSCGTRYVRGTQRCSKCTRTLPGEVVPTEALFREAMYSRPVNGLASKARINIAPYALFGILSLLLVNYFSLGYGPQWAHGTTTAGPGENWHTYQGFRHATLALPGTPSDQDVETALGFAQVAQVAIDSGWNAVIDATTRSPQVQQQGAAQRWATIVAAEVSASSDPQTAITSVAPQLVGANITDLQSAATGNVNGSWLFTAQFNQAPYFGDSGTVDGFLLPSNGSYYLVVVFHQGGSATDLLNRIASGFTPDPPAASTTTDPGAPAADRPSPR